MKLQSLILALLFLSQIFSAARADILPVSRHDRFLTYALFTEEQTGALKLSGRSLWIPVGGSFTAYEWSKSKYKPQFVFTGVAKAWMDVAEGKALLLPQTIDAHVGISFDFEVEPTQRFSAGVYHISGHAADEVIDKSFLKGNVGTEYLFIRYMKDFVKNGEPFARAGFTFKPVLGSDPNLNRFAADQFVEYFPWGAPRNDSGKPQGAAYGSFGVEESGVQSIMGSYHVQLGYAFGDHFGLHNGPNRIQSMRGVLGYYTGWDPRQKFYQLRQARTSFAYFGVMVNL